MSESTESGFNQLSEPCAIRGHCIIGMRQEWIDLTPEYAEKLEPFMYQMPEWKLIERAVEPHWFNELNGLVWVFQKVVGSILARKRKTDEFQEMAVGQQGQECVPPPKTCEPFKEEKNCGLGRKMVLRNRKKCVIKSRLCYIPCNKNVLETSEAWSPPKPKVANSITL
ncbi:unnamed protein product [Soboliphyme baturini]|uniref:DUF4283 domain-containing protein n=1 Tax=Soboliphyme baturini TaxID=241478 RepID=A0A183IZT2_9BILA|nr:unnamed protein product [Soboliphyme baturini]